MVSHWAKSVDTYLVKAHPRIYVLRLTTIVPLSVGMSGAAWIHGSLTPGTLEHISNTSAMTAAWFLVCALVGGWWIVLQWRSRGCLPRGRPAGMAWSPLSNFLCLLILFLPAAAYNHANTIVVRDLAPLAIVVLAYEELDQEFPGDSSDDGSLSPSFYRPDRPFPSSYCHEGAMRCLDEGYKLNYVYFTPASCPIDGRSSAQAVLTAIYGQRRVDRVCRLAQASGRRKMRWPSLLDTEEDRRAKRELEDNVERFFAAHGAAARELNLHGPTTALAALLFLMLLATGTSAASVVDVRALAKVMLPCISILAFATAFQTTLSGALTGIISTTFCVVIVAVPVGSLAALVATKRRSPKMDIVVLILLTVGLCAIASWWVLTFHKFWSMAPYSNPWRFSHPDGQVWCASFIGSFLLGSPWIMRVLDRYRNLPEV